MGYVEGLLARSEKIAFSTRQHWLVLLGSLIVNGVPVIVLAVAIIYLSSIAASPLILLLLILLLFPIARFVMRVMKWWNEKYIITNRRVIQVEGVINKHVIDSSLEKVNDVVLDQSVWGRLLGYGDVEIMTASEIGVNRLDRLGNPVRFKTAMLNQKESLSTMESANEALDADEPSAADIPDIIAELDELRQKNIISDEEFEQKKQELLRKI